MTSKTSTPHVKNNRKLNKDDQVNGRITSWELGKTPEKGTKYVRVRFSGRVEWTGWLTPKTEENTMLTLEILGFKGASLKMLTNDNALDTKTEFSLTIQESRQYKDKWFHTARWVNRPFRAGFKKDDSVDLDEFDIDTSAYIADAEDQDPPASSENFGSDSPTFSADDIPF